MSTTPITPTPVEPEIVQELEDNERDQPGYLREFLGLMHEGKIDGDKFYSHSLECGCFYGWLSTLHEEEWTDLYSVRESITGSGENYTLLETFIFPVSRGDTPATSSILAGLEQAILGIVG